MTNQNALSEPLSSAERLKDLERKWDALAKAFSNWHWAKPGMHWLSAGVPNRMRPPRVRHLESGKLSQTYFNLIKDSSASELQYLYARAKVNFEQAQQAARISIILNVTSFIALIVLVNQIFPGWIRSAFSKVGNLSDIPALEMGFLGGFMAFITISPIILIYCTGGVAMARDLKHLLELSLARRKVLDGDAEEASDSSGDWMGNSLLKDI